MMDLKVSKTINRSICKQFNHFNGITLYLTGYKNSEVLKPLRVLSENMFYFLLGPQNCSNTSAYVTEPFIKFTQSQCGYFFKILEAKLVMFLFVMT
jgi:secreted Zn-dependent insulinase-like peptidase